VVTQNNLPESVASSPEEGPSSPASVEEACDLLKQLSKSAAQTAGQLQRALGSLGESADSGRVGSIYTQTRKIHELALETNRIISELADYRIFTEDRRAKTVEREICQALDDRGVEAVRGQPPYFLVYPGWFKVDESDRVGAIITLNGTRLDIVRPTQVADAIIAQCNDKFDATRFADVLTGAWKILRESGANRMAIPLESIYDMLALHPPVRGPGPKSYTKGDFYFSVHRLAEQRDPENSKGRSLSFPNSNRGEFLFFSRDKSSRKYLSVEFH